MLKKYKLLALVMATVLLFTAATPVMAMENQAIDLLFVVNDTTEKEQVLTNSNLSEYRNDMSIEVLTRSEVLSRRLPETKAIAIPNEIADDFPVENMYAAGVRLYLYGDLTINDYVTHTGLTEFASQIPIYNLDRSFSGKYATRSFSASQRSTKQYQIICEPQNDVYGLLCTIDKQDDGNKIETYLDIISENYIKAEEQQRATIVSSDYDIAHYYFSDTCSVHLTWILYRNYDEEDVTYDYFALESRVWGSGKNSMTIGQTTCEHDLIYSSDHMIDSGPESDSSASSISFTLDVSGQGVTGGSIGYNYNLESAPKITRDTSNYPDSVAWTVNKRLFGSVLDNNIFKFATSWASTGTLAGITVRFGNTATGSAMGQSISMPSGIQTETISFDY